MSGLDLWHFLLPVRVMAYGAAGAVGTRLSLRPLFSLRRTVSFITRAKTRRENEGVCLNQQRHCERSEAIQFLFVALDCFASLAMTIWMNQSGEASSERVTLSLTATRGCRR